MMSQSPLADHTIIREIGRGGMGVVYEAEFWGQRRALKVLLSPTDKQRQRFLREARAVAALDDHPNIVKVFSHAVSGGQAAISFDYIDGQSLDQELQDTGPLSPKDSLRIFEPILKALAHAHAHGILHRDLKPANILKRHQDGQYLLADFGLARIVNHEALTQTGELLGTPRYMAPEQIDSRHEDYGPHTDLWAVAVILYQVLTGHHLFQGQTLMTVVQEICCFDQQALKTAAAKNPVFHQQPALLTLLQRALQPEPKQRLASAEQLLEELRLAVQPQPPTSSKTGARSVLLAITVIALLLAGLWFSGPGSKLSSAGAESLISAFKHAHPDCVDRYLQAQLQTPAPASPAMTTLVEVFKAHGSQWPRNATPRFRKALLFDLLQCQHSVDPSSPLSARQQEYSQALNNNPVEALQGVLTEEQVRGLKACQRAAQRAQLKDADERRQCLQESQQRLGPRDWLNQALIDSDLDACSLELKRGGLSLARAQSVLQGLLNRRSRPAPVLFKRLNGNLQSLCPAPEDHRQAEAQLALRRLIERLSMVHPELQRPRLNPECWQRLEGPSLKLSKAEQIVRGLERWQDGLESFKQGLDPCSILKWLVEDTLRLTLADKDTRKTGGYQQLRVLTAAGQCGLFFQLDLKSLKYLESSGLLDLYAQEHPKSPWTDFWRARCRERSPDRPLEHTIEALRLLKRASQHPKSEGTLKPALLFYRFHFERAKLSLQPPLLSNSEEFLKIQKQLQSLLDEIIAQPNPFELDALFHKLECIRGLPRPLAVKLGDPLSQRLLKLANDSLQAHKQKDLCYGQPPQFHFARGLFFAEDRWRRAQVWRARIFNLSDQPQQAIALIEGLVWDNPKRGNEALVLLRAYAQRYDQHRQEQQPKPAKALQLKVRKLLQQGRLNKWTRKQIQEAQDLLDSLKR